MKNSKSSVSVVEPKKYRSLPDALDHYVSILHNQLNFASEQLEYLSNEDQAYGDYLRTLDHALGTLDTIKAIINLRIDIAKSCQPLPF